MSLEGSSPTSLGESLSQGLSLSLQKKRLAPKCWASHSLKGVRIYFGNFRRSYFLPFPFYLQRGRVTCLDVFFLCSSEKSLLFCFGNLLRVFELILGISAPRISSLARSISKRKGHVFRCVLLCSGARRESIEYPIKIKQSVTCRWKGPRQHPSVSVYRKDYLPPSERNGWLRSVGHRIL
ncbi:hypothetical protein CEXT_197431 [Caerostris extrusa]|uniref:Uncharacterized protein n=1 Tax=Caerostris extrusa TaxID=172846 RepID=A0AAV4X4P4_CAEEX|nr:hypothetical protein CEXT_197431 [Caerostris extrusa]